MRCDRRRKRNEEVEWRNEEVEWRLESTRRQKRERDQNEDD